MHGQNNNTDTSSGIIWNAYKSTRKNVACRWRNLQGISITI